MSDYIKREDAMTVALQLGLNKWKPQFIKRKVMEIPSAIEPCEDAVRVYEYLKEKLGDEIVSDQKEFEAWFDRMVWHVKRCDELSRMVCEDAISRESAVEIAYAYCPDDDGSCTKGDRDMREMLDDLEALPSVAPSRPKGLDELVEGFAKALTYEDVVTAEAEAKGYAQGFKDGMESRPSREWIPCSESLPEEDIDDSYLIAWIPANEKVKCNSPHYYQIIDWEDGDWTNIDFCGHEEIVILAWMPLPEPYKEGE